MIHYKNGAGEFIKLQLELYHNRLLRDIINSFAFDRLSGISFLGAIDHLYHLQWKFNRYGSGSRARHSTDISMMACYVAKKRGYSQDLINHIMAAALLHDIGHAPLSHSVEPIFKDKLGLGHHELGISIMMGEYAIGEDLHHILANNLNIPFLIQLISGQATEEDGGDLFSSPMNLDTIEGICRINECHKLDNYITNKLLIADSVFLKADNSRFDILDKFWVLKDRAYKEVINGPSGLIADKISQDYFIEKIPSLNISDLLENENHWKVKYPDLFSELYKNKDELIANYRLDLRHRNYFVDNTLPGMNRYQTFNKVV